MIKPICERGKNCIFLKVEILEFNIPISARSEKTKRIKKLCYFCTSLKKFKRNSYAGKTQLSHIEKYKNDCKHKVTHTLKTWCEKVG